MGNERVIKISDTIQAFNNERFYLCGKYFQHKGKRLHRAVWEYFNGAVPSGFHVHHKDENKANNDIENLALLDKHEHLKLHNDTTEGRERGEKAIKLAIAKAPEWHKSKEGHKWHSENSKKCWENRQPHMQVCDFCGKNFMTKDISTREHHFCNQNCKAKYARRNRKQCELQASNM